MGGEESPGIWSLLGQEAPVTRQISAFKPEFDPAGPEILEGPAAKADKTGESSGVKGLFSAPASIPRENQAREGEFFPAEGGAAAEEAGFSPHAAPGEDYGETKTGGSGRSVADMLPASARNQAEGLYQFAGSPRPGLVDSLPVGETAGEVRGGRLSEGRKKGRLNPEGRELKTGEIREAGAAETVKSLGFGAGAEKADAEIRVEILPEPGFKGREGDAGKAGGFLNQGLEDALAGELRENLGADIVKQASILVRNQQEGTIRLTLKPETLGNIKIRLEMAENKITGHIIVESQEALKAFERELPVLEKAFRDSGFSETNLDMSMAGNGGSYGQEGGDFNNFTPARAASLYDAGIVERELVPGGFFPENSGQKAVNMLV
ncbi:MAG: flagellar hook-length control protein FliK [Treponema sp.]|nr:flagellar hook-length control protein FliK [Treponema sp.]